jgi:hypothetical protein
MRIVKLPQGEKAPAGADRVIIWQDDGQFKVDGAVIVSQTALQFAPPPFRTENEALAASLKWARQHRIKVLFVVER